MSENRMRVLYGKLEGAGGIFARDPTGYLGIDAGIYAKHDLEVTWKHVQGTEERYKRLAEGDADISFVVGRASLQHFLNDGSTRIVGSSMNRCPYVLVVARAIEGIEELKGKAVACRQTTAQIAPLEETLAEKGGLRVGSDLELVLLPGDQHAYEALMHEKVAAALLPRPFGYLCEERGFRRIDDWPEIVDDPLPITIETLEESLLRSEQMLRAFRDGHREAVEYVKTHRAATLHMLEATLGYTPYLAVRTYDDYLVRLEERLTVDPSQVARLLDQLSLDDPVDAGDVASRWIAPWALRRSR